MGLIDRWFGRPAAVLADPSSVSRELRQRAASMPQPGRSQQIGVQLLTATDGRDMLVNDPDGWEIDQPFLWWMGPGDPNDPGGTGGPLGNPPPGAGNPAYAARTLSGVSRCTSIICDTTAGLPWLVMRGTEQLPTPTWITDPQAKRLDGRNPAAAAGLLPDWRLTAVEFWSQWIRYALWLGDGYVYAPVRDSSGAPQPPLWQLHPGAVKIEDGAYVVDTPEGPVELDPGSMLHLRGGTIGAGGHGSGVLTEHAADMGLALSTRGYAGSQYRNGVPAGYLKTLAPKSAPEKVRELQEAWMSQHGNASRRRIAVLNATTEFHEVNISPLDAQLDTARRWALHDIALAFGVPPYMLGVPGDSATYANVESRMIETRMFTLLPWIRRIESVLDAEFPLGTDVKIKAAGLERADTKTRFEAYQIAQVKDDGSGWMTRDEIRDLEDLPPLGETPADASQSGGGPGAAEDTSEDAGDDTDAELARLLAEQEGAQS